MTDKLGAYRQAIAPPPSSNQLWPLYGAGMENLGKDGKPIEVPFPSYGPDELLIRHDACGLCFSDIKVISQGQSHPRIYKDMKIDPVVLGHEVSMTVIGVGENLKGQYKVGDRLSMQPEVFFKGRSLAYGYSFQGGLSQYSVIGPEMYASDFGNYLIPLEPRQGNAYPGYAEVGLAEPWACVVAAYALKYRTGLKPEGTLWIIGSSQGTQNDRSYTISAGFDTSSHPARLLLTNVPEAFRAWLLARASELNIEVTDVPDLATPPVEFADDIVVLGADPDLVEKVAPRLDQFGILAIMADTPMARKVNVDVGRVHYHRWVFVGSTGNDIAAAYHDVPVRSTLHPGGRAWFVGAGGPMGRMHVQRAIEFSNPPATIVCTDVSDMRLGELCDSFAQQARDKGIKFICLNPMNKPEAGGVSMADFKQAGFDDIVVLAPVPAVISNSANYLAPQGVMNIFAGVPRGTMASLDVSDTYLKNTRTIGHSASGMVDMLLVLDKTYSGELSPARSVAAVGSLSAARDGLLAVKNATLAGKVVIYPNIKELPLTTLPELKDRLPSVYAKLNDRKEWTNEAEEEFLRLMLP